MKNPKRSSWITRNALLLLGIGDIAIGAGLVAVFGENSLGIVAVLWLVGAAAVGANVLLAMLSRPFHT
jgi:hypothetical protein